MPTKPEWLKGKLKGTSACYCERGGVIPSYLDGYPTEYLLF